MTAKNWKMLSKIAKFVKNSVNKKIGQKMQDAVDDIYGKVQ